MDTDNQNRAYTLYESCGFRIATSSTNYRKPFSTGGHLMRSPSTADPPAVLVPDAPDIAGLTFRQGVPDDWATLTDVVNRARGSDGVNEVFGPDTLRADYEPASWFDIGRDLLVAELRRRDDRARVRVAHPARTSLSLEGWGASCRSTATRASAPRSTARPAPASPRRRRPILARRAVVRVLGARRRAVGPGAAPR